MENKEILLNKVESSNEKRELDSSIFSSEFENNKGCKSLDKSKFFSTKNTFFSTGGNNISLTDTMNESEKNDTYRMATEEAKNILLVNNFFNNVNFMQNNNSTNRDLRSSDESDVDHYDTAEEDEYKFSQDLLKMTEFEIISKGHSKQIQGRIVKLARKSILTGNRFETIDKVIQVSYDSFAAEQAILDSDVRYNLRTEADDADGKIIPSLLSINKKMMIDYGEVTTGSKAYDAHDHATVSFSFNVCDSYDNKKVCPDGAQCNNIHIRWSDMRKDFENSESEEERMYRIRKTVDKHLDHLEIQSSAKFQTYFTDYILEIPDFYICDIHFNPILSDKIIKYKHQDKGLVLKVESLPQLGATIDIDTGDLLITKGSSLVINSSPGAPNKPQMCSHFDRGLCFRGSACCFLHCMTLEILMKYSVFLKKRDEVNIKPGNKQKKKNVKASFHYVKRLSSFNKAREANLIHQNVLYSNKKNLRLKLSVNTKSNSSSDGPRKNTGHNSEIDTDTKYKTLSDEILKLVNVQEEEVPCHKMMFPTFQNNKIINSEFLCVPSVKGSPLSSVSHSSFSPNRVFLSQILHSSTSQSQQIVMNDPSYLGQQPLQKVSSGSMNDRYLSSHSGSPHTNTVLMDPGFTQNQQVVILPNQQFNNLNSSVSSGKVSRNQSFQSQNHNCTKSDGSCHTSIRSGQYSPSTTGGAPQKVMYVQQAQFAKQQNSSPKVSSAQVHPQYPNNMVMKDVIFVKSPQQSSTVHPQVISSEGFGAQGQYVYLQPAQNAMHHQYTQGNLHLPQNIQYVNNTPVNDVIYVQHPQTLQQTPFVMNEAYQKNQNIVYIPNGNVNHGNVLPVYNNYVMNEIPQYGGDLVYMNPPSNAGALRPVVMIPGWIQAQGSLPGNQYNPNLP